MLCSMPACTEQESEWMSAPLTIALVSLLQLLSESDQNVKRTVLSDTIYPKSLAPNSMIMPHDAAIVQHS